VDRDFTIVAPFLYRHAVGKNFTISLPLFDRGGTSSKSQSPTSREAPMSKPQIQMAFARFRKEKSVLAEIG
jgi:hypothetical protein